MKLILILSLILSQASQSSTQHWRAAHFRGLTVGKSTRAAMLRVLGQPKWSRSPKREEESKTGREVWDHYESRGEFPGALSVVIDKHSGIIKRIEFYRRT
jgi:hypothetical protein